VTCARRTGVGTIASLDRSLDRASTVERIEPPSAWITPTASTARASCTDLRRSEQNHAMNPSGRLVAVAIDCADVAPVARFYERLLGFRVVDIDPPRWAQLVDPESGIHLNVQAEPWYRPPVWPEQDGRQTKMLHFEVEVDDVAAAVARAVDAGGSEAHWQPPDRDGDRIRIVFDPAGHPLCVFAPGE
jgi:catechol 2,3-dioxygenase-like lactoylglutathione lyase family enzyme